VILKFAVNTQLFMLYLNNKPFHNLKLFYIIVTTMKRSASGQSIGDKRESSPTTVGKNGQSGDGANKRTDQTPLPMASDCDRSASLFMFLKNDCKRMRLSESCNDNGKVKKRKYFPPWLISHFA